MGLLTTTNGFWPDGRAYTAQSDVPADVPTDFVQHLLATGGVTVVPGGIAGAPLPGGPGPGGQVIDAAAMLTQATEATSLPGAKTPDTGLPPPDPTGVAGKHATPREG